MGCVRTRYRPVMLITDGDTCSVAATMALRRCESMVAEDGGALAAWYASVRRVTVSPFDCRCSSVSAMMTSATDTPVIPPNT